MRNTFALALVALIAAPFGGLALPAQNALSANQALQTMRLVVTAEVAFAASAGNGSFGDLAAISGELAKPDLGSSGQSIKAIDAGSGVVLDYTLRVTVSADRQHFQASLTPMTAHGCSALAWFVDDHSIIYTGHPLC